MTHSDESKAPWYVWGCSADLAPSDLGRFRRAHYWLGLWLLSFVGMALGLAHWEPAPGPLLYATAGVPFVLMAVGFVSYGNFLRHADELTRKIQTEGMAIGMGSGLLVALNYAILERLGAPPLEGGWIVIVLVVTTMASITWRQRQMRR